MGLQHFQQAMPTPQGLYDRSAEHDACGVAWVATLTGIPSHSIVEQAITALENLEHRGAAGSEPDSGDGAGILIQIPDEFLRSVVDFQLPPVGHYAVGIAFLPNDPGAAEAAIDHIEHIAHEEQLDVLGWRDLPVSTTGIGKTALGVMPALKMLFVQGHGAKATEIGRAHV